MNTEEDVSFYSQPFLGVNLYVCPDPVFVAADVRRWVHPRRRLVTSSATLSPFSSFGIPLEDAPDLI